jgi:hypothetical protein
MVEYPASAKYYDRSYATQYHFVLVTFHFIFSFLSFLTSFSRPPWRYLRDNITTTSDLLILPNDLKSKLCQYRFPGFRPGGSCTFRANVRAFFFPENRSHGEKWDANTRLIRSIKKKFSFYSIGYEDGYKHGRLHGLIDGRALGAEKGFELWEELGFYEGTARLWTAIASTDASGTDACVLSSYYLLNSKSPTRKS